MSVVLRSVDVTVAPASSASITPGAESISTVANGGSVSLVAGTGVRLGVGAGSGDDALLQTAERASGGVWVRASITAILGGTQAGRLAEIGFVDGTQGAFFRVYDGVLKAVVKRGLEEDTYTINTTNYGIDLLRTHDWQVEIWGRRTAYFTVDDAEVATLQAAASQLTDLVALRAGAHLNNPSATSGTATLDVHRLAVDADDYPEHRHHIGSAAALTAVAKTEGGWVRRARGVNPAAALRYLMLFDKSVAPVNGDVPRARVAMAANAGGASAIYDTPLRFAAGIQAAWSTTADTLTLPGGAEGSYEIDYF